MDHPFICLPAVLAIGKWWYLLYRGDIHRDDIHLRVLIGISLFNSISAGWSLFSKKVVFF